MTLPRQLPNTYQYTYKEKYLLSSGLFSSACRHIPHLSLSNHCIVAFYIAVRFPLSFLSCLSYIGMVVSPYLYFPSLFFSYVSSLSLSSLPVYYRDLCIFGGNYACCVIQIFLLQLCRLKYPASFCPHRSFLASCVCMCAEVFSKI